MSILRKGNDGNAGKPALRLRIRAPVSQEPPHDAHPLPQDQPAPPASTSQETPRYQAKVPGQGEVSGVEATLVGAKDIAGISERPGSHGRISSIEVTTLYRNLDDRFKSIDASGQQPDEKLKDAESLLQEVRMNIRSIEDNVQKAAGGDEESVRRMVSEAKAKGSRVNSQDKSVELEPIEVEILTLGHLKDLETKIVSQMETRWRLYQKKVEGVLRFREAVNGLDTPTAAPPAEPAPPQQEAAPQAPAPEAVVPLVVPKPQQIMETGAPLEAPSPSPMTAAKREGFFKRFISSPMTWAIANLSFFTAVLLHQKAFTELAYAFKKATDAIGIHAGRPSEKFVMIACGAAVALALAITSMIRSVRIGREAEKQRARPAEAISRENYLRSKLTSLSDSSQTKDELLGKINNALIGDSEFLASAYSLQRQESFGDILEESGVPRSMEGKILDNLPSMVSLYLQLSLRELAELVTDADRRKAVFKRKYARDPAFKIFCDELFEMNLDMEYANDAWARAVFAKVADPTGANVGPALLAGLRADYMTLTNEVF
ncbi:MAG: hypothetical protein V1827_04450 [Candidatus Micrarchaeota archaeon]